MATYAASAVLADVLASVDQKADDQVDSSVIYSWIDDAYQALRRRLGDLVPDLYSKVSAEVVVPAGSASFNLTGGGSGHLSLTDFGKIRKVEKKCSQSWVPLLHAPAYSAQRTTPEMDGTYRVTYIEKPTVINDPGDNLVLPEGGNRIVVEEVCARCRVKLEDDPSYHEGKARELWAELRDSLRNQYLSTPQTIRDVRRTPYAGFFRLRELVVELYTRGL